MRAAPTIPISRTLEDEATPLTARGGTAGNKRKQNTMNTNEMQIDGLTLAQALAQVHEDFERAHMDLMPWSRDALTAEELREWLASRKAAGIQINIETCELGCWAANDLDPYGVRELLGELPEEARQFGTNRFVRSPESRGWIWEGDLPVAAYRAMYDRINREFSGV
jgi:hypothetical protein